MVSSRTTAVLEQELSHVIERFHEEQQGCRSETTIVSVVQDMVVARSIGCFTPTERKLVETEDGRKLVKSARRELRSLTRKQIEAQVERIVGAPVARSFWDLDVRVGEQIEVYVFQENIEGVR